MELNVGQSLFEAIVNVTGHTPLESDMQAILSAVEKDNNLKNIDALHGVSCCDCKKELENAKEAIKDMQSELNSNMGH